MDIKRVEVYLDQGGEPIRVIEAPPFTVRIDPAGLSPGTHLITVIAYYADGSQARQDYSFEVAPEGPVFAGHISRAPVTVPVDVAVLDPSELEPPVRPRASLYGALPALLFVLITALATWLAFYGESPVPGGVLAAGGQVAPAPEARPEGGQRAGGAELYARLCSGCHGPNGEGVGGVFPALAGNPSLGDAEYVIDVVLHGKPGTAMPPFGSQLDDRQAAAVIGYIRTAWGNDFGPVSAEAVARARRARE